MSISIRSGRSDAAMATPASPSMAITYLIPLALESAGQHVQIHLIVFHQKYSGHGFSLPVTRILMNRLMLPTEIASALERCGWQGKPQGKFSASAHLASHPDVTTHHLAELPGYGQPQSGPPEPSRCLNIRLREWLEQLSHLLLCHADARINYAHCKPVGSFCIILDRIQSNGPVFGEFAGIAQQIKQYLPDFRIYQSTWRPDCQRS